MSPDPRLGFISRRLFFEIHKALQNGDFESAQAMLAKASQIKSPEVSKAPAKVDADVIVHLGMHKTGSTHVQHHLLHHRKALLEHGILVPLSGLGKDNANIIRTGGFPGHFELLSKLRNVDWPDVWGDLRREVVESGAKAVVISCENMLLPLSGDREQLLPILFDHLNMFRSVRAVAFVRRPDVYVESLYKEIVANGRRMGSRSIQEFLVDHGDLLTNHLDLFGAIIANTEHPLTLIDFDASVRTKGIWPFFASACNFPETRGQIESLPRYASMGRSATEAARLVNTMVQDEA